MTKNKELLFSDDEAMAYIAALENPGKVGWDSAKKVWRTPKTKGYDKHQIAYGLDTRLEHNPIVYNYLKDKGRLGDPWLTDKEAKMLTLQTFNEKRDTFNKAINLTGGNLSLRGYNVLAGMLWHGHPMKAMLSPDSITGKAFRRAIKNGDVDFDDVFDTYYQYGSNKRKFAERIKADAKFRPQANPEIYVLNNDDNKATTFSKQDWSKSEIRIPVKEFKAAKPISTDYAPVRDVPELYDALNGAGSPTYGGYTPRLQDIQEVNSRINHDILNMIGIDPTINKFLIPFAPKYNKGKNATRKSLPRFDEGTPTTVGAYNVYPSALRPTNTNIPYVVTTPEINVYGLDKRPLYQRAVGAPVASGTALYMGAKDFKQENLNNAVNNLKVLAEGVGYNSGKDLPKYGMGEDIINAAVDFGKGVMPVYGTYLDAKEFYNNPSPETLGYLALSALSDGLLLSGAGSFLGMGLKSLRGARAASKAAKALSVTPGKHLARYSAKTAEAARLKKKAVQDLANGVGVDIMPQATQTYNKYAE